MLDRFNGYAKDYKGKSEVKNGRKIAGFDLFLEKFGEESTTLVLQNLEKWKMPLVLKFKGRDEVSFHLQF